MQSTRKRRRDVKEGEVNRIKNRVSEGTMREGEWASEGGKGASR